MNLNHFEYKKKDPYQENTAKSAESILCDFIRNFWNEKVYSDTPNDSISLLLAVYDDYDDFFKYFVAMIKTNPTIFFEQICGFVNSFSFRHWLIYKFLSAHRKKNHQP